MAETAATLLRAMRNGAEILHNGASVEYRPRRKGDVAPWVLPEDGTRYTSAQCQAYKEES